MDILIIDDALLSAIKLKFLLKNRGLQSIILQTQELKKIVDVVQDKTVRYVFVSVYIGRTLIELVNKIIPSIFPQARVILTYASHRVEDVPSTMIVDYDGVLRQPFNEKDLDNLLVKIETR